MIDLILEIIGGAVLWLFIGWLVVCFLNFLVNSALGDDEEMDSETRNLMIILMPVTIMFCVLFSVFFGLYLIGRLVTLPNKIDKM